MLAPAITQTACEGRVAAAVMSGGIGVPPTVMPFILRGVTLRGVDSVMASQPRRQRAWDALAELTDLEALSTIYRTEPMSKLPELADQILAGEIQGRVVIDVNA